MVADVAAVAVAVAVDARVEVVEAAVADEGEEVVHLKKRNLKHHHHHLLLQPLGATRISLVVLQGVAIKVAGLGVKVNIYDTIYCIFMLNI